MSVGWRFTLISLSMKVLDWELKIFRVMNWQLILWVNSSFEYYKSTTKSSLDSELIISLKNKKKENWMQIKGWRIEKAKRNKYNNLIIENHICTIITFHKCRWLNCNFLSSIVYISVCIHLFIKTNKIREKKKWKAGE